MLIAIEGPDGSGKSTLIAYLKEALKGNVLYLTRSGRFESLNGLRRFHSSLLLMNESFTHVILDRHPLISEYVYGTILRNGGLVGRMSPEDIRRNIQPVGVIYCDTSLETILETHRYSIQMKGVDKETLPQIHQRYSDVMEVLKPQFTYDFTVTPGYREFDRIVETLNNE